MARKDNVLESDLEDIKKEVSNEKPVEVEEEDEQQKNIQIVTPEQLLHLKLDRILFILDRILFILENRTENSISDDKLNKLKKLLE